MHNLTTPQGVMDRRRVGPGSPSRPLSSCVCVCFIGRFLLLRLETAGTAKTLFVCPFCVYLLGKDDDGMPRPYHFSGTPARAVFLTSYIRVHCTKQPRKEGSNNNGDENDSDFAFSIINVIYRRARPASQLFSYSLSLPALATASLLLSFWCTVTFPDAASPPFRTPLSRRHTQPHRINCSQEDATDIMR